MRIKYRFSKKEIKDLVISGLVIAFVVAYPDLSPETFLNSLWIVGSAFLLHELGHKFVAQKYDCWAEYRAWPLGLLIGVILVLAFGMKFLAPGAVIISNYFGRYGYQFIALSAEEIGLIGLAGPITNIVLGIIFKFLSLLDLPGTVVLGGEVTSIWVIAASINFWLALFNLMPIPPLDGSKVAAWDMRVLGLAIAAALLLMFS